MSAPKEGSVQWFERARRLCVDHMRALLSIKIAHDSIQTMLRDWHKADVTTQAALHSACVIAYGRPFAGAKSKVGLWTYSLQPLKRADGFDLELHEHLIELRNKIIAHSDYDLFPSTMFVQGLGEERVPLQLDIQAKTMMGIESRDLAERYEKHLAVCLRCIENSLVKDREELKTVAKKHPNAFLETHNVPEKNEGPLPASSGPLPPPSGAEVASPSFPEGLDGYHYATLIDRTPMFEGTSITIGGVTFKRGPLPD